MTNVRHPVLDSRIPDGGFGRALTVDERESLSLVGVRVPAHVHVVQAHGADYIGALYVLRPAGGLAALGVSVTVREG